MVSPLRPQSCKSFLATTIAAGSQGNRKVNYDLPDVAKRISAGSLSLRHLSGYDVMTTSLSPVIAYELRALVGNIMACEAHVVRPFNRSSWRRLRGSRPFKAWAHACRRVE
jgi:hypothetical protein